ncbi:BEN domain-containing protein 2 [Diceros bicornis minor]|uniref:BEN domain-containing protein 2 n=1 Tax=Diceros bicornis minor TaxID=77932 RepID=UPI0026F0B7F7|nr:BEN domain-containing protein 2 [Diceros bicornis minor]
MSEEQDNIMETVGDDSDGNDDYIKVVIDSDTEFTENGSSTDGMLTIQPNFQGSHGNYQQPYQMSYGVEGLVMQGDQAVSQMNHLANFKRYCPNSEEVAFNPLHKKARSSFPGEDNMASNASEVFYAENHQNRLMEVQQCCEDLRELIENTNRQVNHLYGIISKGQHPWEKPLSFNCGDGSPSLPAERQESCVQTSPEGTSLQSTALPEVQQLGLWDSSLPKIVSVHSLQPFYTPGGPVPGLSVLSCPVGEGAETTNSVTSSAQPTLAVPTAVLPQGEPSLANIPEIMKYAILLGNNSIGPDTVSSSLGIPPNFEMPGIGETSFESINSTESIYYPTSLGNDSGQDTASSSDFILPNFAETSLENNLEKMNYPTLLGNDNGQCSSSSSVSLPPGFAPEKLILIEMPGKEETGLENSSQTVYYPALVGSIGGPDTGSSSLSLPPDSAAEKIMLIEMPGKAETSLENSSQTVYYPTSLGNDSGPDTAASSCSIPPNFEMLVKAQTSPEKHTPMVNYPPFLENGCGQDTSPCFFIPPSFESSTEMSSETMNYPTSVENDNDRDTNSESFFLTPGFALLPIEVLVKVDNNVENNTATMNFPIVLENDNSQDSSSSAPCLPSNLGYLGDPKRNVRILDTHLTIAKKKIKPKHAARYLVRILFSKEVLIRSSVGVTSQGRQPLDPNKIAAMREYLATIFPNHDLRECGKDWKICVSDIHSLIRYLCFEARKMTRTTNTSQSADANNKRDGEGSESGSQLSQQTAASETRENGNPQQNNSALPEGMRAPSTDNSAASDETLGYLGNPCRNIQMPRSVLNMAKEKSRPELSARYLIRSLFTDDVLIKSNVYGSQSRGICALDSNRINALREFLQDVYPTFDLSETGFEWKLCVTAINSCIRSLRHDSRKSASKSQPLPATTPSAESGPRDPDLAD